MHSFPPRRDIISCKAQDIGAKLLTLKKLSKAIMNGEIGGIAHNASPEIEMVAETKIILQSLFIKSFAFVVHC
jgi:hypothetical protein